MTGVVPRQPERPLIFPEFVLELQALLRDHPQEVYLVGGAVRDAMLHHPLKDIDLSVSTGAVKLARRIANHFKGDFFVLDAERDVGRTLLSTPDGNLLIDVARFRAPTLHGDLIDRDFTVNAMAVDLRDDLSLVIDPLGGGADLNLKLLRRCAPGALQSDPVRTLRAVRQSVQFGLRIEPETLRDVRAAAPLLSATSPERIRDEFFKLLSLPKAAAALRVADALGLLGLIVPEVAPLHGLEQSPPHVFPAWEHTLVVVESLLNIMATTSYTRTDNTAASFGMGMMAIQLDRFRSLLVKHLDSLWPNERPHRALLVLAALLHDAGKPVVARLESDGCLHFIGHEIEGARLAGNRAEALRLSNDERERLLAVVRGHMRPLLLEDLTPRAVHRFWRQLGAAGVDVCLLALADHLGTVGAELQQDVWLRLVDRVRALLEAYFEKHDQIVAPPPLVDGHRLVQALGLKPGPIVGELIDLIREAQAAGELASAEDALRLAQDYVQRRA